MSMDSELMYAERKEVVLRPLRSGEKAGKAVMGWGRWGRFRLGVAVTRDVMREVEGGRCRVGFL